MTSSPSIRLDRVYKVYRVGDTGVAALGGVTLEVGEGTFAAIVGPSGAGKSTILNLIGGVDAPTAGTVSVGGNDLGLLDDRERARFRRREVGFLWQGATKNLVPYLTAAQNVGLPMVLAGASVGSSARRADELLELLGLEDRKRFLPQMLSGGEQQRVAVAVALANSPSVLLADEPTAEIDSEGADRVLRALRDASRETGATVVMATHDLVAAGRADVTYRLIDGRLRTPASQARVDAAGRLTLPDVATRLVGLSDVEVEIEADEVRIRRLDDVESAAGGGTAALAPDVDRRPGRSVSVLTPLPRPSAPPRSTPEEGAHGPLVSAEGLDRTYGGGTEVAALRDVSIRLLPGEVVAIMGPSGSGKSTLLGLLAGLDEPDAGRVLWEGRALREIPEADVGRLRATRFGIVFQSFGLFPSLSATENVVLPQLMAGMRPGTATGAAESWLTRLGLGGRLGHRVNELSAGQQQRVAIARALACEPAVMLADEPTAELDGQAAAVIFATLAKVARRGGGVLVATHDPRVLPWTDRVVLLRDGRVEAEGPPEEVVGFLSTD
jgi:ABC-type lipoprotein export system ATPase subunit